MDYLLKEINELAIGAQLAIIAFTLLVWIGGIIYIGNYFTKKRKKTLGNVITFVWSSPFIIFGIIRSSFEPVIYVAVLVYVVGLVYVGDYLDKKGFANKHWIY
ncbi:MAG: hypothetical protein F4170_08525, partial [Rhodobacteraceae bacterium]|nr:hypothetical protein [Paracoccaceae bacterium]